MCGIVVNFLKSKPVDKNKINKALHSIHHRGPDSSSIWVSEDKSLSLGHVRLSILDINNGAQPFFSPDKKISAVINGEFYDYENIKKDLEKKGHVFNTNCDSEILIPLYQEYGTRCVEHLRGEFAFVLWDQRKNIIYSVRDRYGIKPLYYALKNNELYIASEIKAILSLGFPAVWNHDAVYLSNSSIYQQERTCFKDIFFIKPGYSLIYNVKDCSVKHEQYWDLNYKEPKFSGVNDAEYIDEFRNKITEAVKLRLRSDVSYACYLSGGLDSTAVLALAAENSSKTPDAFTISFPDKPTDELELARKTAKYIGANHHYIDITEQNIVDALPASIYHGESLICNTHGVGLYLLSKLVNEVGHKVVLTGGGSDEMLYGYEFFREDAIKSNLMGLSLEKQKIMLDKLRSSSIAPGMTVSENMHNAIPNEFQKLFGNIPALISIYLSRSNRFSNFYKKEFLSQTKDTNIIDVFVNDIHLEKQRGIDVLDLASYMFTKSSLPGYILSTIGDKVEMAHSIEGRIPFLDHVVTEYAKNLPPQMKINGNIEKYILRESTKDILPPTIYERVKQPFFAPESSGVLYNFMGEIFNSDILKNSPFYCQKSILEVYNKYPYLEPKNKISTDHLLTEVMSSCLLEQEFGILPF